MLHEQLNKNKNPLGKQNKNHIEAENLVPMKTKTNNETDTNE